MNRRHFLSAISAGAVGAAFLRFAVADGRGGDEGAAARKLAVESLARAKQNGKPLLVLVIPSEPRFVWARGELFGTWLNHADDALLADLALFELVCLPTSALEGSSIRDIEDAKDPKQPLMLLIETHEDEPRAIAIQGDVPEEITNALVGFGRNAGESFATMEEHANAAIHQRDALVSKRLRDAVKIDERLPALADQADAALTDEQRAALAEHAEEPAKIEAALLLRGAAVLRWAAKADKRLSAAAVTTAVAAVCSANIKTASPSGARWARQTGCGFEFEVAVNEDEGSRVACGMGFVPDDGKRFLSFLAQQGG